jgi:hypothetical protein
MASTLVHFITHSKYNNYLIPKNSSAVTTLVSIPKYE